MSDTILAPKNEKKKYVPDPELVQKVEDCLSYARLDLLFSMPFWGQLACRLQLQDATGWCPTAATDGYHFYYNVNFIQSLSPDLERSSPYIKFLFAHEIQHVAYEHFFRRGTRDPKIWNAAADYVINYELVDCKVGEMPEVGLYDKKFADMSSEEVYEWLDQNVPKSKIPMPMDEHLDVDSGDDEGNGSGDYVPGDENNRPKMGKDAQQKIADEMRSAIISAAESVKDLEGSRGADSIPAGMRRMIKQWTEPQIEWSEFIKTSILSTIKDDFSFMNPNRRGELPGGVVLPGTSNAERVSVHIGVDVSGSMSDNMVRDVMGEVVGVTEQFNDFEVHVWCFDAEVVPESHKVFTPENIYDLEEYQILGGGGTDFMANYRYMKMNEIEPEFFMIFTDGMPFGDWGDPSYCDTLYLIHGSKDIKAPEGYGVTVHYERKKKSH